MSRDGAATLAAASHFAVGRRAEARPVRPAPPPLTATDGAVCGAGGGSHRRVVGACFSRFLAAPATVAGRAAAPDLSEGALAHTVGMILGGIRQAADIHDLRVLQLPPADLAALAGTGDAAAAAGPDGDLTGLIVGEDCPDGQLARLASTGRRVVVIGHRDRVPAGCVAVRPPYEHALALALEHLWSAGHRSVGLLLDPSLSPEGSLALVRRAEQHRGHAGGGSAGREGRFEVVYAPPPDDLGSLGRRLLAWKRVRGVTAVVCLDPSLGSAVLLAAELVDLSVPEDLAVVAFDTEAAPLASRDPELTCVLLPARSLGRDAMALLSAADWWGNSADPDADGPVFTTSESPRLVARGSSAASRGMRG